MPPHILITGSSRGIGAACAAALTARGARVIGHATRAAPDTIAAFMRKGRGVGWPLSTLTFASRTTNVAKPKALA